MCHNVYWLTVVCFVPVIVIISGSACLNLTDGVCEMDAMERSWICSGSYDKLERDETVKSLTLCSFPFNDFDVTDILEYFPYLEHFTLMASNVTYIRGRFPPNISLKVLNFTGLYIEKIRSHVFSSLMSLQVLDLRHNRLNHLHPAVITLVNRLQSLYLAGNEWNCAKNLDWVLYLNATVVQDLQNLSCFGSPYIDKPLKPIATFISNLRAECPDPCECSIPHVVGILGERGGGFWPVIQVNCSDRGLRKFPEILPTNTTILLLKGNRIKNVEALIDNRHYRGVLDVFLDNNLITSIDELEGTHWLQHFRVFSLRGNGLTRLPTYAWDNALKRNNNALQIFLGLNPWGCDCLFTPGFQDLLLKYQSLMMDAEDVKCGNLKGDENSLKTIIELSRTSVCSPPTEYSIHALDLLNIVLASLIILILSKLAYDYYKFKKTGQLPWIVTKIP